jgi:hypothetical protein
MRKKQKIIPVLFSIILCYSLIIVPIGQSCKDIIIPASATAGQYSLLLKVRDPSRPGLQVLCRVPQGTQYTYHSPWIGTPWDFLVTHTYLGVATKGDTLPNIVKAGMVLTDAGLAFGDADTLSKWTNPSKNAWDDFDWIRYACQTADNEDEAVSLLTTEAVDELHATGVSENLFLVGPQKAFVIEADALHFTTTEVSDITVMSNYPKTLWQTQQIHSLPIARSLDAQKETTVRKGSVVHLGSVCGIKIRSVASSSITAQVFPVFVFQNTEQTKEVTISLGERATVGPYSVIVREINGNAAKISVCTADYAWEQTLRNQIQPQVGNITILDMIRWSRLHTTDLDNLRPMCEDKNTYEAAMVFKIPTEHATLLSSGWFAANHACASIYIPVHICDTDFYDPYETGDAAALSLALLQKYGHGNITAQCESVEHVFYAENEINEAVAHLMIHAGMNITSFLTEADKGMQEQAYLMEQLWLSAPIHPNGVLHNLWEESYITTRQSIQLTMVGLVAHPGSYHLIPLLENILQSISASIMRKQQMESLFFIQSSDIYDTE